MGDRTNDPDFFFTESDEESGLSLLPCPFCGSPARLTKTTDNCHSPFVTCTGAVMQGSPPCYAQIAPWRYKTVKEAVDAWNRRV